MAKILDGKRGVVLFLITLVLCSIYYVKSVEINTIKQLNSTNNQIIYESK